IGGQQLGVDQIVVEHINRGNHGPVFVARRSQYWPQCRTRTGPWPYHFGRWSSMMTPTCSCSCGARSSLRRGGRWRRALRGRAEFAAGLARRVEIMQGALASLDGPFQVEQAEALYRAAHSLNGTAASFGVEDLADAAGDLEQLARGWLERGATLTDERRVAGA